MNIAKYLKNPTTIIPTALALYGGWIPDKLYLQIIFFQRMGKKLNLKNPQTFSEKLQWLKLYNRKPEYTQMVDKYAVKEYVAKIIGEKYVIPTLGVWNTPEEIDWDMLPEQFVLKTTYGGGSLGVVICNNKSTFNREEAIKKLHRSMKQNIYRSLREWPYKNLKRKIIAETHLFSLEGQQKDLYDYKFFCFNGAPRYCQVITGRSDAEACDMFDLQWKHIPLREPQKYPNASFQIEKPESLDQMTDFAKRLSKDIPFARVDFYNINGHVYFGEITFFPTSGMGGFSPEEWDYKFGELIQLPNRK